MDAEAMTLQELAALLHRDARELERLVGRGEIPGRKVGGEWRFHRAEIARWLETQMSGLSEHQLKGIEAGVGEQTGNSSDLVVVGPLSIETIEVPLQARTRASVLSRLVAVAERSWQVYKPDELIEAIRAREELHSTAWDNGVALPHPRRPMPDALGESVIAYGRTDSGIPFGAPGGQLTDLFFLVLCRDDRTHLWVLARLSRMIQRPEFLDQLRQAADAAESWAVIEAAERALVD